MNERVKKVTTFIKEKWTGFTTPIRVVICAIPVVLIAIIIILAMLLNHKNETVLFTGVNITEQSEISQAITELGVTDVRIKSNGDIIVPEDQADYLRMQLAMKGIPRDASNYDIWNNGINLWSTDKDKQEVARQQREALIAAALTNLDAVKRATVRLADPPTKDYVITQKEEIPSCSVQLELVDGYELKNSEVRAIFNLVTTSVYGLERENVSVTDTIGRPYEWISPEEELDLQKDPSGVTVARRRMLFERDMQLAIKQDIDEMMTTIFGKDGYALNVSALLNYDDVDITKTEYLPVDDNNTGVLDHVDHVQEYIGQDNPNGLVGVTTNADQSPNYPTLDDLDDGESYYYNKDERQYDVSNIITKIKGDGYKIDKLSVGVAIDRTDMSQTEKDALAKMIADAAGAEVDNVSVYNTAFVISPQDGTTWGKGDTGVWTTPLDTYRNILLFVVIALGIILIALLILSLFMSRSRKKKIRRRQEQALAAAQAAAAADVYSGGAEREMPQEYDFNIASLTEEAGKESRETILKREIAEFAKSSPEIVASIIKNMLREEG